MTQTRQHVGWQARKYMVVMVGENRFLSEIKNSSPEHHRLTT
jgi:hypothetical protein